jgi:hypothetical protein
MSAPYAAFIYAGSRVKHGMTKDSEVFIFSKKHPKKAYLEL